MPPIQQQQTSRAGLITSLVLAIIFAVGFLVWAVMINADLTKAQQTLLAQQRKYDKVITPDALGNIDTIRTELSPDVASPRTGTLVDIMPEQRKAIVKLITGTPDGTEKAAVDAFKTAMDGVKANADLKDATIPDTSLVAAIGALANRASTDTAAVKKAKDDAVAAATALAEAQKKHEADIAKRDAAVTEAQAAMTKATADAKVSIDEKQKQVDDFSAKVAESEKKLTELTDKAAVELQTLTRAVEKAKKETEAAYGKLAQFRPNIKESLVRNVDATITQVSQDSICYINLGYGDHVVVGLTFEVYPKLDGVPKLTDGTSALDMPKGKASIEIISIGQNSCQCRILNLRTGATLEQGDLCVNVVYDKHTKPVFFVYGKFDMDGNGVATEGEAEIVKNLIVRWGGKLSDKINIDVDYVVFGKEPIVPLYTPDELNQPIPKAKFDEAKAALEAYMKLRDDAVSLHIPIMNQNRFLYYTGYFDTAKK